jgi:hypothetical protein
VKIDHPPSEPTFGLFGFVMSHVPLFFCFYGIDARFEPHSLTPMSRLAAALLLCALAWPAAAQVPILVEERAGLNRHAEPVTLGIPFAEGDVSPTAQMHVTDADGQALPTQIATMAVWGDGSIRWLKVTFPADVDANQTTRYTLRSGSPPPHASPLTVEDGAEGITVTTGPLRFQVHRTAFTLIDRAWLDLDGDGTFSGSEQLVTASPDGPFAEQDGQRYAATNQPPSVVTVEEAGPLRVVLKIEGRHMRGGESLLKYETRIYAYAGQPFVRIRHTYANGAIPESLGDSGNPAFGAEVDRYALPLSLNLDAPLTARLDGDGETTHEATLAASNTLHLVQGDRARRSQAFAYRLTQDGTSLATGARSEGLTTLTDASWGATVTPRYFWQKNPKGVRLSGDGTLTVELVPEGTGEFLWAGMGTGDELLLHFHAADASEAARVRGRSFGKAPLVARTTPEHYAASGAFYALRPGPAPHTAMDDYVDLVTTNHLANRDALDLYGNLHFGDVPRGPFEIPDEIAFATWGNNYYDAILTAARRFAQSGDARFVDVMVPMARHWMETAAWNAYGDANWMHGFAPAYGIHHRGIGHFQHHYGEGVWAYYYLTGDERAREVGLRAAESIVARQDYANANVYLREAYQRGSAVLEAWKNTRDPRFLEHARLLIAERALATQDAFGRLGSTFDAGATLGPEQTFMMALFSDTVWKYWQEAPNPDPALADQMALLADFFDQYARKAPGVEDYWNFWTAPDDTAEPTPQGTDNPDGTVYWFGRGLMAGTYAYAYDMTGDARYRALAEALLDDLWSTVDFQGSAFWGKNACQAMKNVPHAVALVYPPEPVATDDPSLPAAPALHSVAPNPVRNRATLHFRLPTAATVRITVFDLLGRAVHRSPSTALPPGRHRLPLALDGLPSGVYLYRLDAPGAGWPDATTGRLVIAR